MISPPTHDRPPAGTSTAPTGIALVAGALGIVVLALVLGARADAATITASYAAGYHNVTINDYGTEALGTFTMRFDPGDPDEGAQRLALCIEAATAHSTSAGAYRLVSNRVSSPQLDYLLWKFGHPGTAEYRPVGSDHDTATALAALAWYYAGTTRRSGGAVWANWADGWSPVSPTSPQAWNSLPPFGPGFPVGLRSSGTDLDEAERRVYALHLEATRRRGPWVMSDVQVGNDGSTHSVEVTGPGGPIAQLAGVRVVVRGADGGVVDERTTSTDAGGRATVAGLNVGAGATIEFTVDAPGVHLEWDGSGDIQRMATATSTELRATTTSDTPATTSPPADPGATVPVTAAPTTSVIPSIYVPVIPTTTTTLPTTTSTTTPPTATTTTTTTATTTTTTTTTATTLPPPPHHLAVAKSSSDASFSPAGAEFELLDAHGTVIAAAASDATGLARFAPIDPVAHPGPYELHERTAPPGLERVASPLEVGPPYSTDPEHPTIVELTNHPRTTTLVVRKRLSDPSVGPGDLGGFEFALERVADGLDLGSAVTDAHGSTPPFTVTSGLVRVCETETPPWAAGLLDPGCLEIEVTAIAPLVVEYVNEVPEPAIVTRVASASDGTQVLRGAGDSLVDQVTISPVVPGTTYELRTSVWAIDASEPRDTGITVVTEIEANASTIEVSVPIELPADEHLTTGVVTQALHLGDRLVAEHTDLDDADQTFWRPAISTRAHVAGSTIEELANPGDQLIDELTVQGLPPGEWDVELVWYQRVDGECVATDLTTTAALTVSGSERTGLTVDVGPVEVDERWLGSTLVAFQRLEQVDTVLGHRDCDDEAQTVWIPSITTRALPGHHDAGGEGGQARSSDEITVAGLPDPLPAGWVAVVRGGLYAHEPGIAVADQTCTDANQVATVELPIEGVGTWVTDGERHGAGQFSYAQRLEIATPDGTWMSADHGCAEDAQSFTVEPAGPPPSTPGTAASTSVPVAPIEPPATSVPADVPPSTGANDPPETENPAAVPTTSTPTVEQQAPPAAPARGFPIALPGTGSPAVRVVAALGLIALGAGVVVIAWSAAWPWTTVSVRPGGVRRPG